MSELPRLAAELAELREDLDNLLVLLEPLLSRSRGTATAASPGPPAAAGVSPLPQSDPAHVWAELSTTEAAGAWEVLADWVDWLVERYGLEETLPGCWYRHGAMVDELDSLRAAWAAAYLDPAARATDAAYWLDLLERALERVRVWDRYGCAAGTHHADVACAGDLAGKRRERREFLFADVDARASSDREPAASAPSED